MIKWIIVLPGGVVIKGYEFWSFLKEGNSILGSVIVLFGEDVSSM